MRSLIAVLCAFLVLAFAPVQASAGCTQGVSANKVGPITFNQTVPMVATYTGTVGEGLGWMEIDNITYTFGAGGLYRSPNGFKYKLCPDGTYQFIGPDGTVLASGTWTQP